MSVESIKKIGKFSEFIFVCFLNGQIQILQYITEITFDKLFDIGTFFSAFVWINKLGMVHFLINFDNSLEIISSYLLRKIELSQHLEIMLTQIFDIFHTSLQVGLRI